MLSKRSKSHRLVDSVMILIFQERKFQPHSRIKFKDPKLKSVRSVVKHPLIKQEVLGHTVIISVLPFLVIKKSKGLVLVLRLVGLHLVWDQISIDFLVTYINIVRLMNLTMIIWSNSNKSSIK